LLSRERITKLLHIPVWYAASKVLFHEPVGPPSDVWALACLIYCALGRGVLFRSLDGKQDEVLVEMVHTPESFLIAGSTSGRSGLIISRKLERGWSEMGGQS
jgi:serine/threonine protein kinase